MHVGIGIAFNFGAWNSGFRGLGSGFAVQG